MDDNKIKKEDLNQQSPLGTQRPVAKAGGPKGTGFTNIQSIIKANQGNRLGQTVAGGVQGQAGQVRQDIQQAGQKFGQQVAQNKLGEQDQQAAQGLVQKAQNLGAGQQLSEQELAQGQKFLQGAYQGPRDIQNSAQLTGRAAETEQLGKLGSSAEGRQGLLQRFVGAPQYSFGQQKLDNLLLGANRDALSKARAATRGVSEQAQGAIDTARAQGQEAALSNQRFAQLFGQQAGGAQEAARGQLAQQLEAAKAADVQGANQAAQFEQRLMGMVSPQSGIKTGEVQDPIAFINNSNLNPAAKQQLASVVNQAKALGINPATAINNILTGYQGAQGLTENEFASQEQAARINALAKLAGREGMDFSKAGTFKAGQQLADQERATQAYDALNRLKVNLTPAQQQRLGISDINKAKLQELSGLSGDLRADYRNALLSDADRAELAKTKYLAESQRTKAESDLAKQRAKERLAQFATFEGRGY